MCSPEHTPDDEALPVQYDGPEAQLVDFDSRFGIWWDRDSRYFGIDHGGIASQRNGKHFMDPLARLGVLDLASGKTVFINPVAQQRTVRGYPWGVVQEGEIGPLGLRVTVAYAALDVIAVKIEVMNTGDSARLLRLFLQSRTVPEDWNKKMKVFEAAGEVITTQTSAPTSRFQIRPELDIDIVTGWRLDCSIARPHAEGVRVSIESNAISLELGEHRNHPARPYGFSVESQDLALPPGATRTLSLYVSAASGDKGSAGELIRLVRRRLRAQTRPPDEVIGDARRRWAEIFRALPVERLDALAPALVRSAMMILLRNTIRAQPEQKYGVVMGPHRGTFPCRSSYEGFWIWDCAFQALGFAAWDLELAKDNIRLMLQNQQCDGTERDGRLPFLHPDATVPSAQPPLLSWVAMEIYAHENDRAQDPARARAFLEEVYPKLDRWNRWWFRCRDKNGNGLAEWGNNLESGWDNSPRWDNVDGLAGWNNDCGSTLYEAVDLNAYLTQDLRCLGRMAEVLGRDEAGRGWAEAAQRLAQLVVDVLYDPEDNLFYDTHYATGERRKVLTPASFLPLWAGVPLPRDKVRAMIESYLLSPDYFFGRYPFPSVSYREPTHDAAGQSGYWRGPIWPNIAYFMIEVLARHDYEEEAREASRRVLKMVGKEGFHENYNSRTGERGTHAEKDFSWTAAISIAMGNLSHPPPPLYGAGGLSPSVYIGIRVRDRKLYGQGKEAWIHLANRTRQTVSGKLHFQLPEGWTLLVHDLWAGPEQGWAAAPKEPDFQLGPGEQNDRPVRFAIPDTGGGGPYAIRLEAVTVGDAPVRLGWTDLQLDRSVTAPLPWLTGGTAAVIHGLLQAGDPFYYVQNDREIGRSAPGLVGMLDSRLHFLGRQAVARYIGNGDFIRYALHLLGNIAGAAPLREELQVLLDDPRLSLQDADEMASELLESVVQQTRDMIGV